MRNRKKIILAMLVCIIGLVALYGITTFSFAATPKLRFVLVCYGSPGNPFWTRVKKGMEDAAKLLGVDAVMQFANNDIDRAADFVDTAIANKVDGIGVTLSDPDAFDAPVQRARDAGIPVIGFNIDDPKHTEGNARQAYVGQSFVEAGYALGKRIINLIPEGSHVVCPVEHPDATYAVERFAGVQKALAEKNIKCEMLDSGYQSLSVNLSRIEAYLLGHPETKAVVSLGGMPTEMAPKAIEEVGLKDVINAGFDVTPGIIDNIKKGRTIATVDQQPYLQGFYTVMQLYLANVGAFIPMDMNTGSAIIDQSNVHIWEKERVKIWPKA
ncbi:substrate-binding domain-containing protein [Candidatus Aerophobetes bacterium]|nr:substrate-binding domain-containing protein [Candidatus Aerophobetes bacterium]